MTVTGVAVAALVRAPRSDAWAIGAGALAAFALAFTWGALAVPIGAEWLRLGCGIIRPWRSFVERPWRWPGSPWGGS